MRDAVSSSNDAVIQGGKRRFANRAETFVNRVRVLPGLKLYFVAGAAAVLVMTVAGAFGTLAIPLGTRLLFWLILIGTNVAIWILWFAWRVRSARDWWSAALLGMAVVNAPMPLEIGLTGRMLGLPMTENWISTWVSTLAISIALLVVLMIAVRRTHTTSKHTFPKGILWRSGYLDPEEIAAIESEDHYCRVWHVDGTSNLIYIRFSDLLDEVSSLDGALLRRGQWVAAKSVVKIERIGRKWQVITADRRSIAVSPSAAVKLRDRGWI